MTTPYPKRRRVSQGVAVDVGTGDYGLPPSPTRAPPAGPPSYLSPTRASLARHNPEILQRRTRAAQRQSEPAAGTSRLGGEWNIGEAESVLDSRLRVTVGSMEVDSAAEQQQPRRQAPDPDPASAAARIGASMAGLSRPFPVSSPMFMRQFNLSPGPPNRRHNRTVPDLELNKPVMEENESEPDLPPGPKDPDPELIAPPPGIHSTPLSRKGRDRSLTGSPIESPLVKRLSRRPHLRRGNLTEAQGGESQVPAASNQSHPSVLPELNAEKAAEFEIQPGSGYPDTLSRKRRGGSLTESPTNSPLVGKLSRRAYSRRDKHTESNKKGWKSHAPGTSGQPRRHALPGVKVPDPNPEETKRRENLLNEIAALERDLDVVSTENERLTEALLEGAEISPPKNVAEIADLLRRHVLPAAEDANPSDPRERERQASKVLLRAALNPIAVLPFSRPDSLHGLEREMQASSTQEKPPASHHPIPMTSKEELPYLQTFTPLALESSIVMLPRNTTSKPVLQKHLITATSSHPQGLFAARITMTVDSRTQTVQDLAVSHLDQAAKSELGPFIERIVGLQWSPLTRKRISVAIATREDISAKRAHPGTENNVSVLTWAMGEWLHEATRRARFWALLERELGNRDALLESVARLRTRRRKRRRRREPDGEGDRVDDDADSLDGHGDAISAIELRRYMGRTSMDLDILAESELRVQWQIELDWVGDAKSRIGLLVRVPGKCESHADIRDSAGYDR